MLHALLTDFGTDKVLIGIKQTFYFSKMIGSKKQVSTLCFCIVKQMKSPKSKSAFPFVLIVDQQSIKI